MPWLGNDSNGEHGSENQHSAAKNRLPEDEDIGKIKRYLDRQPSQNDSLSQ